MSGRAFNWYMQRITGLALLVLLILHFWVEHFTASVREGGLTFENVQQRFFNNPWFVTVDVLFLIVALYHGLNGVRNIIFDLGRLTPAVKTGVTLALFFTGLTVAYWGISAFYDNPHLKPKDTAAAVSPNTTIPQNSEAQVAAAAAR
jgi:succinate dehydrogenase / fumarate reductase cytochrome b subunit/succinate dehydrogenase / fumarate reductase membrane anchor subunit